MKKRLERVCEEGEAAHSIACNLGGVSTGICTRERSCQVLSQWKLEQAG